MGGFIPIGSRVPAFLSTPNRTVSTTVRRKEGKAEEHTRFDQPWSGGGSSWLKPPGYPLDHH